MYENKVISLIQNAKRDNYITRFDTCKTDSR